MHIRHNYKHTLHACEFGYITQAIVNNFIPLLFLTFQRSFHISLDKIALLISVNFGVQLLTDMLSVGFIQKMGYRTAIICAHVCSGVGLVCLAFLPGLLPDAYTGILISIILYAVGGGLIEVMVSPIVEACPLEGKAGVMSMLHSFYCWGQLGVVIISTIFFKAAGIEKWPVLACLWAVIPLANALFFRYVPINEIVPEGRGMSFKELAGEKMFWILMMMMLCAGASELGMSQWASAFAEAGLGISKAAGDLMGPSLFALLMGIARWIYGHYSDKIPLKKGMLFCSGLCMAGYLLAGFAPVPWLGLLGCAVCGFSVGLMWPGTFSIGASAFKRGGTVMFAMFALAGDIGCASGPGVVGFVAEGLGNNLKAGLGAGIIFPCVLMIMTIWQMADSRNKSQEYSKRNGGQEND